jgi:GntR family transcriptional regulator, rspAB operon transcriptional repressor
MNVPLPSDGVAAVANFMQASMGSRVYSLLRSAIIQMNVRPGQPLSETDLAKQLNVSRQPVREAFIKLAEAGLVEVRPQRGTYVLLISRREVESARFVREAVEVAFARKAAVEAPAGIIATLREAIALQEAARKAEDAVAFLRHDEAFHQAIARAAGCESVWKLLETLKAQMDRVRFLSIEEATPTDVLITQHKAIADAIEAGDPDAAEAGMRRHLGEILRSLPRIAAAHPELFTD